MTAVIFIVILLALLLVCSLVAFYTSNVAFADPVGPGLQPQAFPKL